jgi:ribosomal protein L37AE/L43A
MQKKPGHSTDASALIKGGYSLSQATATAKLHTKEAKVKRRLISLKPRHMPSEQIMSYCPECGGEMHYAIATKHYICKSCGLSVTQQELMELREKNKPNTETAEEQKENRRKEYLKWWLSKKK